MNIERAVIAPYSADEMFALVDDINSYPAFLPWCTGADVTRAPAPLEDGGEILHARLGISYLGIKTFFATRNVHKRAATTAAAPSTAAPSVAFTASTASTASIDMTLTEGPLSSLSGGWRFVALAPLRCRVQLKLCYAFSNPFMGAVMARVFNTVFEQFTDHFIARAKTQYPRINIEVADAATASSAPLRLPAGVTAAQALAAAGYPAAAQNRALSIFGRPCSPQTQLENGARVEINQPLPRSPQQQRRLRQQQQMQAQQAQQAGAQ